MTKNEFSSLYKNGGDQAVTPNRPSDVTGLSPQQGKTGELLARKDAALLWGKAPLLSVCDPSLTDRQYRILGLLAVHLWKHSTVSLSYPEIGWAVNCSERQVIRDTKALEFRNYLIIHRRHNSVNEYQLVSEVFKAKAGVEPAKRVQSCGACRSQGKRLNRIGICYACADDLRWRQAREELGPEASMLDVAGLLDLKRITKRWEKVARRVERNVRLSERVAC
jgi:hypothetical protein